MATQTVTKPTAAASPPTAGNGKPKKPPEPKDSKFRRLANARVPMAVKRIRHVANLANKLQYTYTEEQAGKIVKLLHDEVVAAEKRFFSRGTTNVIPDLF